VRDQQQDKARYRVNGRSKNNQPDDSGAYFSGFEFIIEIYIIYFRHFPDEYR